MKVLFVVSEVEDLVKTGGLADVGKALPLALAELGHEVVVVMPYYRQLAEKFNAHDIVEKQKLFSGYTAYEFGIKELNLQGVKILAVDRPEFFARKGLYADDYHAYLDNAERFAFFAHAALKSAQAIHFQPDIVHCNDWHTALTPYFVSIDDSGFFANSRTIFTIHNGAYQGTHRFKDIPYLQPHYQLHGQLDGDALNYVRMGIRYANKINAVSPNYGQELLSPLGSHYLFEEFQRRQHDVTGILNGCDYSQWDPNTDPHIAQTYNVDDLAGKYVCKADLQREAGLPQLTEIPVIGMVCRLTEQKGFSFILPILEELLQHRVQVVIIGTGDPEITHTLNDIAARYPDKLTFIEDFSVRKAHMIEAGSDFFLMPSLFEPCGLNQMYSLAYGTLPIVRAVGGLKDTVIDVASDPENATGFSFITPDSSALLSCIRRALIFFHEDQGAFEKVKKTAMRTHFTWRQAAENYVALYHSAR
ncbi:glycogen synthase GlgA [Paraglaciecola aquimarina]|uniref:Glycogen synthase n=1 Tax=Paraglaciecola aquimarina TaxID=1235557 RepID=A0ABU3SU24_9ALTE|nr:glycogen synthase GlgA [Paraglaciecola aquimarina]MDU0353482.1 glycogen synthase GlgA [Paraglaciecola aquimarina]